MPRSAFLFALLVCIVVASGSATPAKAELATSDTGTSDLQEITVTATKESSSLSKVPLSITAISNEGLEMRDIRDISDLSAVVPGVTFSPGFSGTSQISIRGVASESGAATTGIYIDDTPIQSRAIGAGQTFSNVYPTIFDLDRVEVLRGPQGTLFGSGSEGGTIRFITAQPSLTTYSGMEKVEGRYTQSGAPSFDTGAAFGGPIVEDVLGFRMSVDQRRDGGYIDRVAPLSGALLDRNVNYRDNTSVRAAVTWAPVDGLTVTPSFYYQRAYQNAENSYWGYLSNVSNGDLVTGAQVATPKWDTMALPALSVSMDFAKVRLMSSSSYYGRRTTNDQNFSNFLPAGLGYPISPGHFIPGLENFSIQGIDRNRQNSFTQEFRLQSTDTDARLDWLVGAYYQHAKQSADEVIPQSQANLDALTMALFDAPSIDIFGVPVTPQGYSYHDHVDGIDEEYAGFGRVTYKVTDRLSATAGARVARTRFSFNSLNEGPLNEGTSTAAGSQQETPVTPKFGLSYQLDSSNLFYATAAKGFRGGGANTPVSSLCNGDLAALGLTAAPTTYKSDSVWSYEVGAKDLLFDNRLRLASSLFLINWTKIQQLIELPSCGLSFVTNVGGARSKGFDLQADFAVFKSFTIGGSIGYTNARYTETVLSGVTDAGTESILVEDGNGLGAIPWIFTSYGQYDFNFNGQSSFVRADYRYSSPYGSDTPENDSRTSSYRGYLFGTPAISVVDLKFGTTIAGLEATVFVDNVTDYAKNLYLLQLLASYNRIDEFGTVRPRTYGVSLKYRF